MWMNLLASLSILLCKLGISGPQMVAIVQHWVPPLVGVADLNFEASGNLGLDGVGEIFQDIPGSYRFIFRSYRHPGCSGIDYDY